MLDPIDDLKITDKAFKEIVKKNDLYEKRMRSHPMHKHPERKKLLDAYGRKDQAAKELEKAKTEVKKAKSLLQMADLKCMKRVLRRLDFCSMEDVIEYKAGTYNNKVVLKINIQLFAKFKSLQIVQIFFQNKLHLLI